MISTLVHRIPYQKEKPICSKPRRCHKVFKTHEISVLEGMGEIHPKLRGRFKFVQEEEST